MKDLGVTGKGKGKEDRKATKIKSRPKSQQSPATKSLKQGQEAREERDLLGKQVREKRKIREREEQAQRAEKLQRRAAEEAARELVETHRLTRPDNGVSYRFNLQGTIRRIFVTQEMADQLSNGELGIIAQGESYEVVAEPIARKIESLSERLSVVVNEQAGSSNDDPDDPYSDYKVPDDLVW